MTIFYEKPFSYAVKLINNEERVRSQSGGMFAALSDAILESNGIIYGCAFNEKFEAVHIRAEDKASRDTMRYSKYVQSNMNNIFKEIAKDLTAGRLVLFSGTSCQVAGLRKYIDINLGKRNRGCLYVVDIVCHGVPSPLVWKDYLKWEQKRKKSIISNVICRNKSKFGWKSHVVTIEFVNQRRVDSFVFPRIFYSHNALRPSCYRCPYKNIVHPGDITIADYWGIDKVLPGFKDDKGVSLVLINNEIGASLFEMCKDGLIYHETNIEDSLQKPLIEPYNPPENRNQFWQDYKNKEFSFIAKKYGGYNSYSVFRWKIRHWLKWKFGI